MYEAQEDLEKKHREEEDRLLDQFKEEREKLEEELRQQADQEWEGRLRALTSKFDTDMAKKTKGKKGYEKKVGRPPEKNVKLSH